MKFFGFSWSVAKVNRCRLSPVEFGSKGDWEETVGLVACALEVLGRDALGKCRVLLKMRYPLQNHCVSWILFLAWQTLCLFGCLWIRRGDGHPPLCSYIPSGRVLQNLYSFPWKSIRNQEVVWIFMDFPSDFHGIFPWDFLQTKPVDPSMGIFLDAVVGFLDFDRSVAILPKAVPRDHGPKPGWMRWVRLYYEQWNREVPYSNWNRGPYQVWPLIVEVIFFGGMKNYPWFTGDYEKPF